MIYKSAFERLKGVIKYKYIGKKTSIITSNVNKNKKWLNEFKFDYNNLENDKEKICKILL